MIGDIIKEYKIVSDKHRELNRKIKEHYEPLLSEAGKKGDKKTFNKLLSELPDCPFVLTAYRIEELYKDNF